MTCIKKFLYSVAFVFLFSVFTVFGISPNTSAISDYSLTITNDFGSEGTLVNGSTQVSYNYILISASFSSSVSNYSRVYITLGGDNVCDLRPYYSNFILCELNSRHTSSTWGFVYGFSNLAGSSGSVTFLLSENNPLSSAGITPEGSLNITENGTFDVTNYAEVVVNVPTSGTVEIPGDYHEDLVSINNSIIICAGAALVIYFFYAIYRMMFKGVKS